MLYALRQPAVLLGLALGFVAGSALRVQLVQAVAGIPGIRRIGGRRWRIELRRFGRSRRWLDPFGAVAAVLTGVGWGPTVEASRGRRYVVAAAAVLAHAALTAAGIAGFLAAGGLHGLFPFVDTAAVLHGSSSIATSTAQRVCLGFGIENLGCALLSLVPIPPLELGTALWSSLPRTPGSRRMAYHLLHEQWGVAVLLVLLLVPLGGSQPPLLALLGAIGDPIMHAL
ncbi:MAG TPA: hypothetical protein VG708_05795 [Mycobacteriales bacterium]|nr:hypothetical protein [Mycobacteriales bacterium]